MRTAQIGPYLRLVKILLIFLEYILQFVINAATGRISWGKSLEIILIYGTVVKGIILNAVGSGFDSRSRNFYFLFLVVLVLSVWLFCVGRRRVGHGKVYIFCNFSVSQWFFFFFFQSTFFTVVRFYSWWAWHFKEIDQDNGKWNFKGYVRRYAR